MKMESEDEEEKAVLAAFGSAWSSEEEEDEGENGATEVDASSSGCGVYKLTRGERKRAKWERTRERRRLNRKAEKQRRRERRNESEDKEAEGEHKTEASSLLGQHEQIHQTTTSVAETSAKKGDEERNPWKVHRPRLVIDMSFDSRLEDKEVRSVANQIQMSYGWYSVCVSRCARSLLTVFDDPRMRSKCERPLELHLTSLTPRMEAALNRHVGYYRWPIGKHECCYTELFVDETEKLVYLTPDASDVLEEINEDKIYIIGGIADTHIQKGLTLRKARDQGIPTVCLPLKKYEAAQRNVLNVNHVVEIMTLVAQNGNWKTAFDHSVPKRRAYQHDGRVNEEQKTGS